MNNIDEIKSKARRLYIDGLAPARIAETLSIALDAVRELLGLAPPAAAVEEVRAVPPPQERGPDPGLDSLRGAVAIGLAVNQSIQDREQWGYRVDPDGGKLRDGSPAPAFGERARVFGPHFAREFRGRRRTGL